MTKHCCEICGSDDAYSVIDPFISDVENREEYRWLCEECEQMRRDDI